MKNYSETSQIQDCRILELERILELIEFKLQILQMKIY